MLARKNAVSLRRATLRDLPLIKSWLVQRDIARLWGSPVQNFREMRLIFGASKEDARIYLIRNEKRQAIGLISLLHARLIASALHDWPADLPLAAWEIGILIGARGNRRQGIGTKALRLAHEDLPGSLDEPVYAYILPGNEGSRRTFEKLGYQCVPHTQPLPDGWIVLKYVPNRDCHE